MHTATEADISAYQRAVAGSRERVRQWNPVNPHDLAYHLRNQSGSLRTFLIRAKQPLTDHDVVGRVNVANIQRGRSHSAGLGYDAYDPYAGRGLFAEGLRLIVDLAFRPEPHGLGLHRVEAHVQPGNLRSAGMLRSLGFRRRGAWPAFLWLPDGTGAEDWRDHVTYGVTEAEWPAPEYPDEAVRRPVVFLLADRPEQAAGLPAAAEALGRELGVPVWSADPVLAAGGRGLLVDLLGGACRGAVVFAGSGVPHPEQLTRQAGLDRAPVVVRAPDLPDRPADVVRLALFADAVAGGYTDPTAGWSR